MGTRKFFQPQTRAFLRIIWWTICLIFGLTFANFLFVLHTVGPGLQLENIPLQLTRTPASYSAVTDNPVEIVTPLLSVDCKSDMDDRQLETFAPTMRVKFLGCPHIEKILNATNASQGDTFPLKNGWLTSDFIFLSKGRNEIFVQFVEKTLKIEVNRNDSKKEGVSDSPI